MEDYARFALDDAHLTRRLKEVRHALRDALTGLPAAGLVRSRDTQTDVGTTISTQAEMTRKSPPEVAQAAFKRAQEAVRSLEEFGKLVSPLAAARFERLRYELYTLEKALALADFNAHEFADRQLYLLATDALCPHGIGPAIRAALAGGVAIVQLREKEMPERRLLELGRRVRVWTREAGALFIMNDRADLAVAVDADGVHLGQDELPVKEARAIVGPRRLVGVSTHSIEQARRAVLDGADYLGVGPVFPSATKAFESLAGLELVRAVAAEISLPWFAIGGINAENVAAVATAGARRIAVSHAILERRRPGSRSRHAASKIKPAAGRDISDISGIRDDGTCRGTESAIRGTPPEGLRQRSAKLIASRAVRFDLAVSESFAVSRGDDCPRLRVGDAQVGQNLSDARTAMLVEGRARVVFRAFDEHRERHRAGSGRNFQNVVLAGRRKFAGAADEIVLVQDEFGRLTVGLHRFIVSPVDRAQRIDVGHGRLAGGVPAATAAQAQQHRTEAGVKGRSSSRTLHGCTCCG